MDKMAGGRYINLRVSEDDPTNPRHYNRFAIQPLDFISQNRLDYLQGNIIKYVCRYDAKGGVEDLKKAKVYLEKLIEMQGGEA